MRVLKRDVIGSFFACLRPFKLGSGACVFVIVSATLGVFWMFIGRIFTVGNAFSFESDSFCFYMWFCVIRWGVFWLRKHKDVSLWLKFNYLSKQVDIQKNTHESSFEQTYRHKYNIYKNTHKHTSTHEKGQKIKHRFKNENNDYHRRKRRYGSGEDKSWKTIHTIFHNVSYLILFNLSPSTRYHFRVTARSYENQFFQSSNTVTATTKGEAVWFIWVLESLVFFLNSLCLILEYIWLNFFTTQL